jgi:hypothetical protein
MPLAIECWILLLLTLLLLLPG